MAEDVRMFNEIEQAQPALAVGDRFIWRGKEYRAASFFGYPVLLATPIARDDQSAALGQMTHIDMRFDVLTKLG